MLSLKFSVALLIRTVEPLKITKNSSSIVVCAANNSQTKFRIGSSRRIGINSKAAKLASRVKRLSDVKEEIYGALDCFIAWDINFPVAVVKKALKILEKQKEWKRVIQVAKWMLSKGQARTMGSYFCLINALAQDGRLDEAEAIWSELFSENLDSMPRLLFVKMISIYYNKGMYNQMFEIFADMDELGIRPEVSIVTMVGNTLWKLGMMDKYDKLRKKYSYAYRPAVK